MAIAQPNNEIVQAKMSHSCNRQQNDFRIGSMAAFAKNIDIKLKKRP
jgi:hypothetical protein